MVASATLASTCCETTSKQPSPPLWGGLYMENL